MKTEQIIILVVAFFLGMLLLNMVKNVCGCDVKEGFDPTDKVDGLTFSEMKRMYFDSDDNGDVGDCFERLAGRRGNETCPNILTYKEICSARNDTMCNETGDSPTILQYFQDETENCANIDFFARVQESGMCAPADGGGSCDQAEDCNNNGSCVVGKCECNKGSGGPRCSEDLRTPNNSWPILWYPEMDDQEADMVPWANILQFFQSDDRQASVYPDLVDAASTNETNGTKFGYIPRGETTCTAITADTTLADLQQARRWCQADGVCPN